MQVSFTGHETFPFRYGWLKKGVDAVRDDAFFFSSERAMVDLGVGKNMVQSIKHWCLAAGLLEGDKTGGVKTAYSPSEIGQTIIFDEGFDPFFEDPASLWLLQWRLASNRAQCTTWFWLFNHWHSVEFTKEIIFSEMQNWLARNHIQTVSEQALRRDIDCCLRTYVHSRQKIGAAAEETFDCPLTELNLVAELEDGKTFQFRRGEQKTLPDEILLFTLDEFWRQNSTGGNSLPLEKLVYGEGSPGRIFKIDAESLTARLDRLGKSSGGAFSYQETSGIKQVLRHRETNAGEWLTRYYAKH